MDPIMLSKKYMDSYQKITTAYETSDIKDAVSNLNEAIKKTDTKKTNDLYSQILDWNFYVAHVEGSRISLNTKYAHLHLPSVEMFTIVFDPIEKIWKFNI